jgi:flagellar hook-basal body complex protein FliE
MPSELQFRLAVPSESIRPDRQIDGAGGADHPGGADHVGGAGPTAFGQALGGAIQQLDKLQVDADQQADAIARGEGNLHEVALAFEKADVAMRLATRVRNKLVEAYNDIMRMSV